MENNILSQKEEQVAITEFFEEVSEILKECDECQEKEKIKEILHDLNDVVSYVFFGEESVGKTTLLKEIFQNVTEIQEEMSAEVCEYRYGEMEFTTQVVNGFQKKFVTSENLKGISITDTKGLNALGYESKSLLKEKMEKCYGIFVILDSRRINSPVLWDFIEDFPYKNMIFFMTKCDLISQEELTENIKKIQCYMKEASISAPIFPVCCEKNKILDGVTSLNEVRLYIRKHLIGDTPLLAKQRKNIEETRMLLEQMKESFLLRQKQYASDVVILQKMHQGLDAYIISQEETISDLIQKVTVEINKDINTYQDEIISKMDPYKIKERFKNQQDFMDYLNMVNENYKNEMNTSVNRKIMETLKDCLNQLEIIFDEAVGYFNERESILTLNDKFYGSLSVGRERIVTQTKENALVVSQFYKTLTDASETVFLQMWEERRKHDAKLAMGKTVSGAGGTLAGGVGGVVATKALITAGLVKAGAVGLLSGIGIVSIGAIVGATITYSMAKAIYEPMANRKMEEVTQNCIEQFKEEINKTRSVMIEQITSQIREIFKGEISSVDGLFTEFRMSVNLDEMQLPLLQSKLEKAECLLKAMDNI